MEQLLIFLYVLFLPHLTVNGDSFSTVVPISIELNSTDKSGLRYGFQKTSECLNFQKAFLCIQKCLDLNFDVAYADKHCKCKCYYNKGKAKYTIKYNTTKTNWKLGAPTTSIPPWAQEKTKTEATEPNNIVDINDEDSANESDPSNSTGTVPTSNENMTEAVEGVTKDEASVGPLANGTESSVANGTATVAEIAAGTGSGVANSTATVVGTESGVANSTATIAGTAAETATKHDAAAKDGTTVVATKGQETTHAKR